MSEPKTPEVKVNLMAENKELIIRTGEAAPIDQPQKVEITGTIDAPRRFVLKRRDQIKPENCYVAIVLKSGKIVLYADEHNKRGTVITGVLTKNGDLDAFGINGTKKYPIKELSNFLRMHRAMFPDKEEHQTMIGKLSEFVARVNTEIKQTNDRQGHTLAMIEKKVSHEIPLGFKLSAPLYEGQPAKTFAVEVLADVTDSSVQFWLESVELQELYDETREKIINAEREAFSDYVVIDI